MRFLLPAIWMSFLACAANAQEQEQPAEPAIPAVVPEVVEGQPLNAAEPATPAQSTPEKDDPAAKRAQQAQLMFAAGELLDNCMKAKINTTARVRLDIELRQLYASVTSDCGKNRRERAVKDIEKLNKDVARKSDLKELGGCVKEYRTFISDNKIPVDLVPAQNKLLLMLGSNADMQQYLCK